MHQNNFIVSLKSNGKILREKDNTTFLPFGSEYSILLKNLDSRKAKVGIYIDGEDVLNGQHILAHPNENCELEGFLDGLHAKNKFKFINKTEEISDHRGDRLDDGIIRVEFTFEKEVRTSINYTYDYYPSRWYDRRSGFNPPFVNYKSINSTCDNISTTCCYASCDNASSRGIQDDEGITVKGSEINQQFNYGSIEELEETSHVIILKLKGTKNGNVTVPLTVKTKLICSSCGKSFNSNMKYCSNCGTFLEIK